MDDTEGALGALLAGLRAGHGGVVVVLDDLGLDHLLLLLQLRLGQLDAQDLRCHSLEAQLHLQQEHGVRSDKRQ